VSIVVKNLTKVYGEQKALDNISFEIPTGQVVGFLGPNGAGKSTTMKILTCYIPQTEGTVDICGYSNITHPLEVKQQIGYLPESNPLYKDMYVKEYLNFVGSIYQLKNLKDRVKEMIDLTGLTVEQDKKIMQLSKGYKQRLGIAQAMISDPKVLILDEPTSALDPNQLDEIRRLIANIGKHKTVLLSTHIMQEVEAMCERVIIINKGKIVADDIPSQLRKNSTKETVITVEINGTVDALAFKKINGVTRVSSEGAVHKITHKGSNDIRQDIFNLSVSNGWTILSLSKEEQDLEDIFKSLTKGKE